MSNGEGLPYIHKMDILICRCHRRRRSPDKFKTAHYRLLKHLDTLSADYYDETPVGAAMYPLKEPIEEIAYFGSDLLPAILRMLLTTTFTLVAMSTLSPLLTLTVLPLIPVFLITRQCVGSA